MCIPIVSKLSISAWGNICSTKIICWTINADRRPIYRQMFCAGSHTKANHRICGHWALCSSWCCIGNSRFSNRRQLLYSRRSNRPTIRYHCKCPCGILYTFIVGLMSGFDVACRNSEVSEESEQIIKGLLQLNPERRFTATQVRQRLEMVLKRNTYQSSDRTVPGYSGEPTTPPSKMPPLQMSNRKLLRARMVKVICMNIHARRIKIT